jgi:lipoteichoic acid synthase
VNSISMTIHRHIIRLDEKNSLYLFYFIFVLKLIYSNVLMGGAITKGGLLTTLGFTLIFIACAFLFAGRSRKIYLLTINIIISILLLSDLLYYKYFHSPLTLHVYFQVSNLSGLGPSIISLLEWKYIFLFLDFLFIPSYHKRVSFQEKRTIKRFMIVAAIGLIFIIAKPMKNHFIDQVDNFQKVDSLSYVRNWGPLGHHVLDTFYFVKDGKDLELTKSDQQRIESWYDKKNRQEKMNRIGDHPLQGFGKGKNLILIQVESLQNFVINKKVDGQEITPFLNSILDYSLYFPRVYPQTIEGNSSDAELMINTSLYPIQQGSTFFRFPENEYPALGKYLKKLGYRTFAIHGDEKEFWNRDQVYPKLGIDQYYDLSHFELDEEIGMGLGDDSMFRQSLSILEKQEQPYFAFYITLTSHIPFEMPEEKRFLELSQELNDSLIGKYYQSIRYTDQAIGTFMQKLSEKGILDHSIVVIYGDHEGIHKKDKEEVERWISNYEITDEEWYRTYNQIPLIIYHPDIKGEKIHKVGGQIDVLPTLAYIMGIDGDDNRWMGRNLLTIKEGSAVIPSGDYTERAFITDDSIQLYLEDDQEECLMIADLIIRSNYFKKK